MSLTTPHTTALRPRDGKPGFSYIELLISIGIIGVLTSIVIVAINPRKQFCETLNAERKSNEYSLTKSVQKFLLIEWGGGNPPSIPTGMANAMPICRFGITDDETCVNMDFLIPNHAAELFVDTNAETNPNYTGYGIYTTQLGKWYVVSMHIDLNCDPLAEGSETAGATAGTDGGSGGSSSSAGSTSGDTGGDTGGGSSSDDSSPTSSTISSAISSEDSSSSIDMSCETSEDCPLGGGSCSICMPYGYGSCAKTCNETAYVCLDNVCTEAQDEPEIVECSANECDGFASSDASVGFPPSSPSSQSSQSSSDSSDSSDDSSSSSFDQEDCEDMFPGHDLVSGCSECWDDDLMCVVLGGNAACLTCAPGPSTSSSSAASSTPPPSSGASSSNGSPTCPPGRSCMTEVECAAADGEFILPPSWCGPINAGTHCCEVPDVSVCRGGVAPGGDIPATLTATYTHPAVPGCGFTPCSGTVTMTWDPLYGPYADDRYGAWLPDNYVCGYGIGLTCIPEEAEIFIEGFVIGLAASEEYSPNWNICSAGAGPIGSAADNYDPFEFDGWININLPDGGYGNSGPINIFE